MNSVNVILIDYELQTFFHNNFHPSLFSFSLMQLLFLQVFCIKTFIFKTSQQNSLICLQHLYYKQTKNKINRQIFYSIHW